MNFQVAKRVQTNFIFVHERRFFLWICRNLPAWVTPDHATALSAFGALVAFIGYAASRIDPAFLFVATGGLVMNWAGDSLDGNLARSRGWQRPRYGYFIDHSVDALSNLLIMAGLGLTLYVRLDVALFALLGYYLLCIYVFLYNQVTGVFELTFAAFGPTELKIGIVVINLTMYAKGMIAWTVAGTAVSLYDLVLLATSAIFVLLFLQRTCAAIVKLYGEEPPGPHQRSETKASTLSK